MRDDRGAGICLCFLDLLLPFPLNSPDDVVIRDLDAHGRKHLLNVISRIKPELDSKFLHALEEVGIIILVTPLESVKSGCMFSHRVDLLCKPLCFRLESLNVVLEGFGKFLQTDVLSIRGIAKELAIVDDALPDPIDLGIVVSDFL